MQGGSRFEFEVLRSLVPLGRELQLQRLSARIQEIFHSHNLSAILIVATAFKTGCETHLHFGIDAAWKRRVRIRIVDATPHFEEVERIVEKLLGGHARKKWSVINILSRSLAPPRGHTT